MIPVASDALSALTTPTHQVHTAHVTPSAGGSTSTQMDSGPPTLLCQMMSSASARSQPAAPDGSITTTFGGHQYNVYRDNHTSYQYSYDIHENSIMSIVTIIPHINIPMIFMKTVSNLPMVLLLTVELMVVWLVPIPVYYPLYPMRMLILQGSLGHLLNNSH